MITMSQPKNYQEYRQAKVTEFQKFCDLVGEKAELRGLTEEKLNDVSSECRVQSSEL